MEPVEIKSFLYSFEHPMTGMEDWEICLAHIAEGLYKARVAEPKQGLGLGWFVLNFEEEKDALASVIKTIHDKFKP